MFHEHKMCLVVSPQKTYLNTQRFPEYAILTSEPSTALRATGDAAAIEENLLLTTHNDLVSFITDYRKNRTGKPTSTYAKMSWNPNFRDTKYTLENEMTPLNIRKWRAEYTVSWLYDLVNTYAATRLDSEAPKMVSPEKLDWDCGESGKCEWTNRPLWYISDHFLLVN